MCVLFCSWQQSPEIPLVLLANRDEFHPRPTQVARWWETSPPILAGLDETAGGTWLGVTHTGRFAAITNIRDPADQNSRAPSRGRLLRDFLLSAESPADWLEQQTNSEHNGYNLLCGDRQSLFWHSNRADGVPKQLGAGLYGLSNAELDTPWPKIVAGKQATANLLKQDWTDEQALALLNQREVDPDAELPDTGVGPQLEQLLAPIFICSPGYGTRASTVVRMQSDGQCHFTERSYAPDGGILDTRRETFQIEH